MLSSLALAIRAEKQTRGSVGCFKDSISMMIDGLYPGIVVLDDESLTERRPVIAVFYLFSRQGVQARLP